MKARICLAIVAMFGFSARMAADTTLVFNELMYHPNAGTNEAAHEWIEFYNQLGVDLDISGWRVTGEVEYQFPPNTRVPGRSFIVLAADPAALTAATGITNVFGPVTNRLSNAGGPLELRNQIGRLMDFLEYETSGNWPVAADGAGVSLAKRDRDLASGPAENWTWSAQVGGTPGAENMSGGQPIKFDSHWAFYPAGSDPGGSWRNPGYDDAAWPRRQNLTNSPIPTLFNTGIGANGAPIADGAADPHYVITAAAQGTVGANATVILNHPSWLANDTKSKWIGVANPGSGNVAFGSYNYRTTFSLEGYLLSTVQIELGVAADDNLSDVVLNGVPVAAAASGYAGVTRAGTLKSGFNQGTNTLEFRTINGGTGPNPHGFRTVLASSGIIANNNPPLPAGQITYYFRNAFVFNGDPRFAAVTLNTVVADGAIFYLNGVEVHRQNMPAGPVTHVTPASQDLPPAYSAPISLSADALVRGTNVLAVELHQAAGSADGPVLGAELAFEPGVAPVAFNEFSPTTNALFWIELMNNGASPLNLDGAILHNNAAGTNYEYALPAGTTIPARGFLVLSNTTFGFPVTSSDRLYLYSSNRTEVYDAVDLARGGRVRIPNATGEWRVPSVTPGFTPGASNQVSFRTELVVNEIMYERHRLAPTNDQPSAADPEAWIEIFNRSGNTVDLTGWELDGAVRYRFPSGRTIAPGGYLVIAADSVALAARYPAAAILGNYEGRLSHRDEKITLRDPSGNPADSVHYYNGGRWPEYARGGGSSLELRDPWADNAQPEAWAASDESSKAVWQTFTYRMVAAQSVTSAADGQWRDFVLGLLGAGECLIDDISVVQSPDSSPIQFIDNGNFEGAINNWRVLGTHGRSRIIQEPGNPGNRVLHLVATGPQEHMHNHIETTLSSGRSVANGQTYEISFRARWIAGNNLLNTRLYFNRCARTSLLPRPDLTGTPGAQNSQYAANVGPTFEDLRHLPVVPQASEPVTVSIRATDAQGVASATLYWSVNGGAWTSAPMSLADGQYRANIPALPSGTLVQFYVGAVDGLGASSTFPAAGPQSGVLYRVNDGLADMTLNHNLRVLMSPANIALLHASTNVMSNEGLPCTIIYDERVAYYDMRVRLKSSQRGRDVAARVGYQLHFPPHDLFRGVHPVLLVDRSGGGGRPAQEEILLRHMVVRGDLHSVNPDIYRILAPQAAQNGPAIVAPRYEDEFLDAAFENGNDGTLWELELTYYPTTANAAGYKLPQPDAVQGVDFSDLGEDKERYRYNFLIKNHRGVDDYSRFITFAKIWSTNGAALDAGTRVTMDVDQWLKTYAMISLCGVGDMYTFGNNHNFMVYLRPDNRMLYLPWDMDFSFTRGATASLVGDQNLAKIVNLAPNLRRLYAHMLDHIASTFNTTYMAPWVAHYGLMAGADYSADLAFIQQRGDYVRAVINGAGGNSAFAVAGASAVTNGGNVAVFSGTAPVGVTSILINGNAYPITWNSIASWTVTVPVAAASNHLEFVGVGLDGAPATNAPISRTVYYTNAVPDPEGAVVFSEILFDPVIPGAEYIELFNTSSNFTFDLSGWRINGVDFTFPNGTIISNRQHLVVAANSPAYLRAYGSQARVPVAEFSGSLQRGGERLTLLRPGANGGEIVVDRVRYEGGAPWPVAGAGSSVQLIDSEQENARVGNWGSSFVSRRTNDGWRFVSVSAPFAVDARFLIGLDFAGSVVLDDIFLVHGSVPEVGYNFINNGNFESPLDTNVWRLGTNMAGTSIIPDQVHSGNGALRLVQTSAGSSSVLARNLVQTINPKPTNTEPVTLSFWYYATNNTATNLTVRFAGNFLLNRSTDIRIQVLEATNVITPGAANLGAASLPQFPPLWINEVQPGNLSGLADGAGERDPWIELYNPSTNEVSLEGLYLSTDYGSSTNWSFPAGSVIGPREFKIVWCDGHPGQGSATELHASFRLPAVSGSVSLLRWYAGQPQVLDYLDYSQVHPDRSYGSFPDGQPFDRLQFFHVTPGGANNGASAPLTVFINEWMAGNATRLADPADGGFEDWFELYNPGPNPVDLAGFYLTDNLLNKFQYQITTNGPHLIPAGGYLLVWADEEPSQNTAAGGVPRSDLHVNFALRAAGEAIALFAPDGTQIDAVMFGAQTNDVSQGRYPDGGPSISYMPGTASPRAPNYLAGSANNAPVLTAIGSKTVYAGQTLSFQALATDPNAGQLLVFSLDPGAPEEATISAAGLFSWTPIASGTYVATVRVTDNGVPPLGDSETITIQVLGRPRFSAAGRAGNALELTWDTHAGQRYRVEYKDDLGADTWTLLQEYDGTGSTLSITNSTAAPNQRFYRVRIVE